jgi:capsular polysaccharide transport system ATP-binding protein
MSAKALVSFYHVTKVLGRTKPRVAVLNDVNWSLQHGTQLVVLGQIPSFNSAFLDIVRGSHLPTSGWVRRRGIISGPIGIQRYVYGRTTARQLVHRLARLYLADPLDLAAFVEHFADFQGLMDYPLRSLPRQSIQKAAYALFYGLPCDLYLFDGRVPAGPPSLRERCAMALHGRRTQAATLLVTSIVKVAEAYGGAGAILHNGQIQTFSTVQDAVAEFKTLEVSPAHLARHMLSDPSNVAASGEIDLQFG